MLGPADASAQLIQIGQAESVRAVDDDRVRIWNIETALDDCRANQHIDFSGHETGHDGFEFVRAHLAVPELDPGPRTKLRDLVAHFLDRLDAVVEKINLALPVQLAVDGVANDAS